MEYDDKKITINFWYSKLIGIDTRASAVPVIDTRASIEDYQSVAIYGVAFFSDLW